MEQCLKNNRATKLYYFNVLGIQNVKMLVKRREASYIFIFSYYLLHHCISPENRLTYFPPQNSRTSQNVHFNSPAGVFFWYICDVPSYPGNEIAINLSARLSTYSP